VCCLNTLSFFSHVDVFHAQTWKASPQTNKFDQTYACFLDERAQNGSPSVSIICLFIYLFIYFSLYFFVTLLHNPEHVKHPVQNGKFLLRISTLWVLLFHVLPLLLYPVSFLFHCKEKGKRREFSVGSRPYVKKFWYHRDTQIHATSFPESSLFLPRGRKRETLGRGLKSVTWITEFPRKKICIKQAKTKWNGP